MDVQLSKRMTVSLTVFVIGATIALLLHTPNFSTGLISLSCAYILVVLIRDYILKIDLQRAMGAAFLIFQLLLALAICVWSESFFAQAYLFILIGEFSFHHKKLHSIIFTTVSYISILIGVLIYRPFSSLADEIYLLFPRVIDFYAIFGMSLLAKIAFLQKNQLAKDNEQLRIASVKLERTAKLEERTRISREIHDSVGHTLTSALTGLQTATHALEKQNYHIALEMISRTTSSIRKGLNDVRTSVHLLRENIPGDPFIPELMELIDETMKQTGVDIVYDIDFELPSLPPKMELAIYRALQEGLTNGIRHGGSTRFEFSLTNQAGNIRFVFSNNGNSPSQIVRGFGLNAMKERVEEVGGELSISTVGQSRGVTLTINIPIDQ